MAEESLRFRFFMSQLTRVRSIKNTEKTCISVVFYEAKQAYCILRECKGRDLSVVCDALCRNRHPNTVVVYDYIYENGSTYILEENITGTSLEQMLSEGKRFSEKETAQMMIAVCDALEPLHGLQPPLVHNDINPSNIMLREDGSIKLFDFDISRIYKKGAAQNTELFGTEEYASPEHYGYGQSEPRTDIYSMGVTMHKLLTGKSLTAEHHITYGGKLRPVIEKCLRLDPKHRYRDVQALRKDLEEFLSRKKRLLPLWAVAAAGLVLLGSVLWLRHSMTEGEPEQLQAGMTGSTASQTDAKEEQFRETDTPTGGNSQPTGAAAGNDGQTTQAPDGVTAGTANTSGTVTEENGQATEQPTGESVQPTGESTQPIGETEESTAPSQETAGNHTQETAMPIAASESCTVVLEAGLSSYYVFTLPETGQYIVTLENGGVPCRVLYSGDRGLGSLFSGWADNGKTTTRSFRAQAGDLVCIRIKANDVSQAGACVLRVDPA